MARPVDKRDQWLAEHPEELTRYPGQFIAIAEGGIVAHGRVFADVLKKARKMGYEPLMARSYDKEILEVL
jgi:hypothetical protein